MRIFFEDKRFSLTASSEFLVRLVSYSAYAVMGSVVFLFLFSGTSRLTYLGLLLALFLTDRLMHAKEGEKNMNELKGERVNAALAFTPAGFRVLFTAFRKSLAVGEDFHLLLLRELTAKRDVSEALRRLDVEPRTLLQKIEEYLKTGEREFHTEEELRQEVEALALASYENARETNERFVGPRNIFVALAASTDPQIVRLFDFFNLAPADVREAVIVGRFRSLFSGLRRLPAVLGGFAHRPRFLRHRVMNRAWTARPTPTLDAFSTDLTDLARAEKIGFLVGHEAEFSHLLDIISRPGKPNALLVGEPGTGKSTIIAHLAFRMIKDEVPKVLYDKRLVSLEIGKLVADATSEVLAGRFRQIVEEILFAGNIVLFIPTIHDLFRTGGAGAINAIDMLLPILKSESIPIVGETYPREFKQYIIPRSDFLEQFETVEVNEISESEALRFLVYQSIIFEKEYKLLISFRALRKTVEIAHRYFRAKTLPGSAVDLLKQALAKAHEEHLKTLDERVVIEIAERQSKIPIAEASGAEAEKLLNLEEIIHKKLVNQEVAVKAVARALREYRSGLSREGGTIANFLFVGPTGVGKTELAKILAKIQFGSKEAMHRFDMSEYQDKQSIFRFIGTPDGQKTGALTDAVLENPYSLILLDEFEKAHPDILNLFLQVFDDGRLTDSLGRTADFSNTIIIATSNANSDLIKEEIEAGHTIEEIGETLKKKLTNYFKPELINRFSDIIVFRSLNQEEIVSIAGFLIKEVADTLQETHGITLSVEESALRKIAELGFSPVFGARPLRQVISEKVRGVLAEKLLRKEISRGDIVKLVWEGGDFQFQKA